MDEIAFLDSLSYTIHIIIFTETWILDDEIEMVNLINYNKIFACRKNRLIKRV